MDYKKANANYLAAQVLGASPNRLIEMLLEGAIKQTKMAIYSITNNQIDRAHQQLINAQEIVSELESVLDVETGGEIATQLKSLYVFIYEQLVAANIKKEIAPIEKAQQLLNELLGTWKELMTITD